jgi:[acyl-carrier-protein] S-malonyltransferase
MAGHSLGEYSALVVSGALAFGDAVRLVRRRGEFMQEAVPAGDGAMAAIIGLDLPLVEEICREAAQGEVVEVANINAPIQVVVAGHRRAVARAVLLATERGGRRSVLLPVSAPFHCRLMIPAAERLAKELDPVAVSPLKIPVVRNVDGEITSSHEDVKPSLVKQVAHPVRWSDCVRRMAAEGVRTFIETGPGRVLTGLLKRIEPDAAGYSVEDPAGLERAISALKV